MNQPCTILIAILLAIGGCSSTPSPGFDPHRFGAVGDGTTNDTAGLQSAIDACAQSGGGKVTLRAGHTYRSGTLSLPDNVVLHLEKGAVLLASDNKQDYPRPALIVANNASNIGIEGEGTIDGRSRRFMQQELPHIFRPGPFRPAMILWTGCSYATIRSITIKDAPQWTVHLAGCQRIAVEGVKILNDMKVPNCDGIDVDHCRDVDIRDCDIRGGDDCIVLKTTRKFQAMGPCEDVSVSGCRLQSNSCAIKIGSETVNDIRDATFDSCTILDSNRGLGVQQRDEGNVENIRFSNMTIQTSLRADDWWGKAEPIYVTSLPRSEKTTLGRMRDVWFINIECRGEGGGYIAGCPQSRPQNIVLDNVRLRIDKTSPLPGGQYDRRPTTGPGLVSSPIAAIYCEQATSISIRDSQVSWGHARPDYYGAAIEAHAVDKLELSHFEGTSAHAGDPPIINRP